MLLGELEQLVLLAVLRLGDRAHAIEIRRLLSEEAGQDFSRGSIYAALQRLTAKGFLSWATEESTPARGGIPRRCYAATKDGIRAVRDARRMVDRLALGLDEVLADA